MLSSKRQLLQSLLSRHSTQLSQTTPPETTRCASRTIFGFRQSAVSGKATIPSPNLIGSWSEIWLCLLLTRTRLTSAKGFGDPLHSRVSSDGISDVRMMRKSSVSAVGMLRQSGVWIVLA